MRYLISGGQGFLGSFLATNLINKGHFVKTIGKSKDNDFVVDLSKKFIKMESNFDYIIHTASVVHNELHNQSFNLTHIMTDVQITENFLKSISEIRFKKFIFLSSVSVYGLNSGILIDTNQPTYPLSGYGLSKLINEKIIDKSLNNEKLLILRLPLVNGPNAKGNIKKAREALIHGKMILFKNNTAVKSILEISDLFYFIEKYSHELNGIHHLKSYDIEFNKFVSSLSHKKPILIPFWAIKWGVKISLMFKLKKLHQIILKTTRSLTFKNTAEWN